MSETGGIASGYFGLTVTFRLYCLFHLFAGNLWNSAGAELVKLFFWQLFCLSKTSFFLCCISLRDGGRGGFICQFPWIYVLMNFLKSDWTGIPVIHSRHDSLVAKMKWWELNLAGGRLESFIYKFFIEWLHQLLSVLCICLQNSNPSWCNNSNQNNTSWKPRKIKEM